MSFGIFSLILSISQSQNIKKEAPKDRRAMIKKNGSSILAPKRKPMPETRLWMNAATIKQFNKISQPQTFLNSGYFLNKNQARENEIIK
ncbi:MAG: hypothetical protein Q8N21_01500 [bacterium]|nr:hypothetical protein [bacterium]